MKIYVAIVVAYWLALCHRKRRSKLSLGWLSKITLIRKWYLWARSPDTDWCKKRFPSMISHRMLQATSLSASACQTAGCVFRTCIIVLYMCKRSDQYGVSKSEGHLTIWWPWERPHTYVHSVWGLDMMCYPWQMINEASSTLPRTTEPNPIPQQDNSVGSYLTSDFILACNWKSFIVG